MLFRPSAVVIITHSSDRSEFIIEDNIYLSCGDKKGKIHVLRFPHIATAINFIISHNDHQSWAPHTFCSSTPILGSANVYEPM